MVIEAEQKEIKEMFHIDPSHSLREHPAIIEFHFMAVWDYLRKEVMMLPYCLQNRRQLSEADN